MRTKLTTKYVESVQPLKRGRLDIWDLALPGFGLRISETGRKSWVVMLRVNGRQRRKTIGKHPIFSLSEAREQARNALRLAELGVDPTGSIEEDKNNIPLFKEVVKQFIEIYAKPRNRSWKEAGRCLRVNVVPYLGDKRISEITRQDINYVMDIHMARGVATVANRTLAHIRKLLNWCVDRGLIDSSPANGVKAPAKEVTRDRVLSDEEIMNLWPACEEEGWPFGAMYKLLLITGQRRGEVAGMHWSEIEGDVWTIPASRSKNGRSHKVPLSALAIGVLSSLPRVSKQDLVFTTNGRTPVSGFAVVKSRIDMASDLRGWRVHDLRRTAASGMARLGVSPHVVEKILNHSSGTISGVAAVYNRYGYDAEKRTALNLWSERLLKLVYKEGVNETGSKSIY